MEERYIVWERQFNGDIVMTGVYKSEDLAEAKVEQSDMEGARYDTVEWEL